MPVVAIAGLEEQLLADDIGPGLDVQIVRKAEQLLVVLGLVEMFWLSRSTLPMTAPAASSSSGEGIPGIAP